MKQLTHFNISKTFFILLLLSTALIVSGCAAFKASKQPDKKDLSVLNEGTPRSQVIAELGSPVLTEEKEGRLTDIFAFTQGYSKGNKVGRTLFHGFATVTTLGLWEVVGTPAETIASGRKMQIEVVYDEEERVEKVTFYQGDRTGGSNPAKSKDE